MLVGGGRERGESYTVLYINHCKKESVAKIMLKQRPTQIPLLVRPEALGVPAVAKNEGNTNRWFCIGEND